MLEFSSNPLVWAQFWIGSAIIVGIWHFLVSIGFALRHNIKYSNFLVVQFFFSPTPNVPLMFMTALIAGVSLVQGTLLVLNPFTRPWGVFLFPSAIILIWLFGLEVLRQEASLDLWDFKETFKKINNLFKVKKEYLQAHRRLLQRMKFETIQLKQELAMYDSYLTKPLGEFLYQNSRLDHLMEEVQIHIDDLEPIGKDIILKFNEALHQVIGEGNSSSIPILKGLESYNYLPLQEEYEKQLKFTRSQLIPGLFEFIKQQQVVDNPKLNQLINTIFNQPTLRKDEAFIDSIFLFLKEHESQRSLVIDNLVGKSLINSETITRLILPKGYFFALNEKIIMTLEIESFTALLMDLIKKEINSVVEALLIHIPSYWFPQVRHVVSQLRYQEISNPLLDYVTNYLKIHNNKEFFLTESTRYENMNLALKNYFLRNNGDYPNILNLKDPTQQVSIKQLYDQTQTKNKEIVDHAKHTFLLYSTQEPHSPNLIHYEKALRLFHVYESALEFEMIQVLDLILLFEMVLDSKSATLPTFLNHLKAHPLIQGNKASLNNLQEAKQYLLKLMMTPAMTTIKNLPNRVKSAFILIELERLSYDRWIGGGVA